MILGTSGDLGINCSDLLMLQTGIAVLGCMNTDKSRILLFFIDPDTKNSC